MLNDDLWTRSNFVLDILRRVGVLGRNRDCCRALSRASVRTDGRNQMMSSRLKILAGAASIYLVPSALAQFPPITDPGSDERKCEDNTGKTLAKVWKTKLKCVGKCMGTQRRAPVPFYFGCLPPYFDPAINVCI